MGDQVRDERVVLHVPGELPAEVDAARQDWDGLRPALRERLSDVLGAVRMWWRDHDDPHRTTVHAFGERAMGVATPVTQDRQRRHRIESRQWVPGSLTERRFGGQGPDPGISIGQRAEHGPAALETLPAQVRGLLGHLPSAAQWYLQVPLLAAGEDGATNVDGARWYHVWDRPDRRLDAWLWLRVGRVVTFAHGRRECRGGGRTPLAQWDLRCWRATCS